MLALLALLWLAWLPVTAAAVSAAGFDAAPAVAVDRPLADNDAMPTLDGRQPVPAHLALVAVEACDPNPEPVHASRPGPPACPPGRLHRAHAGHQAAVPRDAARLRPQAHAPPLA